MNENIIKNSDADGKEHTILSFILLLFIFLFQYSSKLEEIKTNNILTNDNLKKAQLNSSNYIFWKYLILLQLSNGINFFLSINLENEYSNSYSFILSGISLFLFLIIFGKKIISKNKGLLIYGLYMLSISIITFLISIDLIKFNSNYFIIETFIKISEISMNLVLINNFELECNEFIDDFQIKTNLINNFIEKSELTKIFIKIFFKYILSKLNDMSFFKQIGNNSLSNILSFFLSILFIIIILCWRKIEKNNKNIEVINNKDNNYKLLIIIGITEFLINSIYSLYKINLFGNVINIKKEMNNYYIYNLFIPSFLAGITSFRLLYSFYNYNISNLVKLDSMVLAIGIILILFSKDFNKILNGALLIEAALGLYSILSKIFIMYVLKNELIFSKIMIWFYLEIINMGANTFIFKYNNNAIQKPILFCFILSCIYIFISYLLLNDIIIKKEENNISENHIKEKNKKKKNQ